MPHYINKLDVNKNVDEALLDNLFLQKCIVEIFHKLQSTSSKSIFQTRFTILKTFSEGVSLPAVTQIYKNLVFFSIMKVRKSAIIPYGRIYSVIKRNKIVIFMEECFVETRQFYTFIEGASD